MKKILTILSLIITLSNTYACGTMNEQINDSITIYYLPFKLETYTAITKNNIEKKALYVIELKPDDSAYNEISKIFMNHSEGEFDNRVVRMKVKGSQFGDLYVDQEGGILIIPDEETEKLTSEAFERLSMLMDKLVAKIEGTP